MKSCVIDRPAETQLDLHCMPISALLEDNYFATVPVVAIQPAQVAQNKVEEEIYTLFEEAISERVAAVSRQLNRLSCSATSGSLPALKDGVRTTSARVALPLLVVARVQQFWQRRRRLIALVCLGLNLLLMGFDCMGLLVLAR